MLQSTIASIFAGGIHYLGREGHRTGMYKRQVTGSVPIEIQGIAGDEQADRHGHGGPEKAVHQYAIESYRKLIDAFPQCQSLLVPGSIGENLSVASFSESDVHIGDIFRVGTATLQVSQPRSPCWKINHRYDVESMSQFIAENRITGWYYRVLKPGALNPGDEIVLLDRLTSQFSIDRFWKIQSDHRPPLDILQELSLTPGLAPDWQQQLSNRVKWLQKTSSKNHGSGVEAQRIMSVSP